MSARDAVIVDAVRTPVGKRNGSLAELHAVDLSAHVLQALVERTGIDPAVVDDVIWGCVQQVGQQACNVGRMAVLAAGWPESVPGTTVDRQCGSSQQAMHFAAAGRDLGPVRRRGRRRRRDDERACPIGRWPRQGPGAARAARRYAERYGVTFNQGIGAEMIAEKWGLSRGQLDEFALPRTPSSPPRPTTAGPSTARSPRSSCRTAGARRRRGHPPRRHRSRRCRRSSPSSRRTA